MLIECDLCSGAVQKGKIEVSVIFRQKMLTVSLIMHPLMAELLANREQASDWGLVSDTMAGLTEIKKKLKSGKTAFQLKSKSGNSSVRQVTQDQLRTALFKSKNVLNNC
jgi:hypothetical protein